MKRRHFRFSVLVPLALIAASLWLLVGCLYIPTPEIVYRTGSKKDFRPLVGEPGSGKPIVVGRISRAGVEALLGLPPYISSDGRRAMYVIHLDKDIVFMPLCFTFAHASDHAVGLILNFDEVGLLKSWEQLEGGHELNPLADKPGITAGVWQALDAEERLLSLANGVNVVRQNYQPVPEDWILRSAKDLKKIK